MIVFLLSCWLHSRRSRRFREQKQKPTGRFSRRWVRNEIRWSYAISSTNLLFPHRRTRVHSADNNRARADVSTWIPIASFHPYRRCRSVNGPPPRHFLQSGKIIARCVLASDSKSPRSARQCPRTYCRERARDAPCSPRQNAEELAVRNDVRREQRCLGD